MCGEMIHTLPAETSVNMGRGFMEKYLKMFVSSSGHSDSLVTIKKTDTTRNCDNKMLKVIFEEVFKQRQKCTNSTRFMDELWKARNIVWEPPTLNPALANHAYRGSPNAHWFAHCNENVPPAR
jgi:hypothetical protein